MVNILVLLFIIVLSLLLALASYRARVSYDCVGDKKREYKNSPWQWKFFEVWNFFFNFFLGGLLGYYLIAVRCPSLIKGETLTLSDFVLFFIFATCIFGLLPYMIRNLTEGINGIVKRVLEGK